MEQHPPDPMPSSSSSNERYHNYAGGHAPPATTKIRLPPPGPYDPLRLDLVAVYFGNYEMQTSQKTELHPDSLNMMVLIPDDPRHRQIDFQIAFRHIVFIELACHERHVALFLSMAEYGAKRIREALEMDVDASVAHRDPTSRFLDARSPIAGHRYVTLLLRETASLADRDGVMRQVQDFVSTHVTRRLWERNLQSLMDTEYRQEAAFCHNYLYTFPPHSREMRDRLDAITQPFSQSHFRRQRLAASTTGHASGSGSAARRRMVPVPGTQRQHRPQQQYGMSATTSATGALRRGGPSSAVFVRGNPQRALQPVQTEFTAGNVVVHAASGSQVIVVQQPAYVQRMVHGQPAFVQLAQPPQSSLTLDPLSRRGVRFPLSVVAPRGARGGHPLRSPPRAPRVIHQLHIDDDEEDGEGAGGGGTVNPRHQWLMTYGSGRDSIKVQIGDYATLLPEQFLNDTTIEFYLSYILHNVVDETRRPRIHLFSTFFWGKLSETPKGLPISDHQAIAKARYQRVKSWTKSVDLFGMDYVVVPIHEEVHWVLAVIAFPGRAIRAIGTTQQQHQSSNAVMPYIVILDSLADEDARRRYQQVKVLKDYLECEWNEKHAVGTDTKPTKMTGILDKDLIRGVYPKDVPQQNNYWDCGVFLLQYAELFLSRPPTVVSQSNSFAHWFGESFSVENKRVEIMQLIERLSGERWTNVKHLVEQVVEEVKRETEVERQRMPGQQQMVLVQTGRDGKAFVYACSPNEVYAKDVDLRADSSTTVEAMEVDSTVQRSESVDMVSSAVTSRTKSPSANPRRGMEEGKSP